ncbi:uncharacterized protein LOC131844012 [Achroia grisella]|uniref:uncharacterized protein LOC131844012 n=1 Tax=Achroia grisella TaxID=688607 RepID=UPI0027D2E701|nr:uncharacterized protein LOC131844012 [Achroia grisella]
MWKWVALTSLIAANLVQQRSPVVNTWSGRVRGSLSADGTYHQYLGIPYATVDHTNRFQASLPPPRWKGIFDAVDINTSCPQKAIGSIIMGTTNCLKLNVYTPANAEPDQLLPVMVFIHGGCFLMGTGGPSLYGPDFFVDRNIVFVTINYRLNIEGFLCLGIKEAPGNAGLKDQVAALKWIQENIKAFGGDPNQVTLFGESAGAASVSFLLLSPAAKGLFHKVILQSGSPIVPWGLQHDPLKTASTLVKEFGYDTKNPYEIYSILANKSAEELINAIVYLEHKVSITAETLFVPCVEKSIPSVEPMLTEYPMDIIKSGNHTKVPMIIGVNDNEGIYFVAMDYGTSLKNVAPTLIFMPLQPDLEFLTDFDRNETAEKVMGHYFSSGKDDYVMDMVDYYSDVHFKYPSAVFSELYQKTSDQPVYYYVFKYNGYINMAKISMNLWDKPGASHADELFYLFKPHSFPLPLRYLERNMINRMVSMWTNFAKYSDPTPARSPLLPVRWPASGGSEPTALIIDAQLSTGPIWDRRSLALWNELYAKYGKKTYRYFTPVLEISQGKLRGIRSVAGVNKYYGIPYATCERFQPPKEPENWKGIFNAVDIFGCCAQAFSFIQTYNEDCLQLDVYTPDHAKVGDNFPVLMYIHGGAYYYGSKGHYDPEFLVTKNVTAVIVNYRLGVLGFLCLNDVANLGLKDQVAALKWIKKNIAAFGGDPDNVTLIGQSAGASSAAMHMLSEKSKGLFHKIILMSGNSLSPWAFNLEPTRPAVQDAEKLTSTPITDNSEENLFNIFFKASVPDILTATVGTSDNTRYFKYTPCVDNNFTDPFFHDTPYNIIKSGDFNKVPILAGATDLEGSLFYGLNDAKSLEDWEQNFVERLPSVFSWCSEEDKEVISNKFRSHYFGKKRVDSSINGVVKFYSDWIAESTTDAFSDLMTDYSEQPVYNYVFSYQGGRNFAKALLGQSVELKGASHSDDIFYVFKPAGLSLLLSNSDKLFIDRLTAMLTNFMKHGNPTPRRTKLLPVIWPASTGSASYVMHLDHRLSVSRNPRPSSRGFFLDLLCTYGHKGYVPCDSSQQCNVEQNNKI